MPKGKYAEPSGEPERRIERNLRSTVLGRRRVTLVVIWQGQCSCRFVMLGGVNRTLAGGRWSADGRWGGLLVRERTSRSCSSGAIGIVGQGATDIVVRIAAVGGRFKNESRAQPASHPSSAAVTAYSVRRQFRSFQTDKKNRIQGFQSVNPYVN